MQIPPPLIMEIDPSIWRAIAGAAVRIPAVNSFVHYFPQGHLEYFSVNDHNFNQMPPPLIPCKVTSVSFLSDAVSDQVFAKILLHPIQPHSMTNLQQGIVEDGDDIVSFAKILTLSDANNGGGFSVPRFCAEIILPQLDFKEDPPVQYLVMRDTQSNAWKFRHIYRGSPRRHLLTTGWSKYVNAKQLVAGDSVVFMRKNSTNELFLGARGNDGFRGDAGVDRAQAMSSAIENALRGMPFEVVYYPKVGLSDFVVAAGKVEESLQIPWGPGMRVRMAVEKDGSSEMTWIQGVVNTAETPATGPWIGSPWRMLQVSWEEHESCSQKVQENVSPWEVECIPLSPLIEPNFNAYIPIPIPPPEFTHPPSMAGMRDHDRLIHPTAATNDGNQEPNNVSTVLSIGTSSSPSPVIVAPVNPNSVPSSSRGTGTADPGHTPSSSFMLFGQRIISTSSKPAEGRFSTKK